MCILHIQKLGRALRTRTIGEFTLYWIIRDNHSELRSKAMHIVRESIFQGDKLFVLKA